MGSEMCIRDRGDSHIPGIGSTVVLLVLKVSRNHGDLCSPLEKPTSGSSSHAVDHDVFTLYLVVMWEAFVFTR